MSESQSTQQSNQAPGQNKQPIPIPSHNWSTEFWVGVFTLIGVVCFGYLAINLAKIRVFNSGDYFVKAQFDNVAGLKLGAPVEVAGVQIGEVTSIELEDVTAILTFALRPWARLRDDDTAAVRTKGIIGDRYIKIIPGGAETTVEKGGTLSSTESAVELEEILGKFIHRME